MHVLTKIFIVLVCLLAILIVPLVVVYAQNEENFKKKYEQAVAATQAATAQATSADARFGAEVSRLESRFREAQDTIAALEQEKAEMQVANRRLESELIAAQTLRNEIRTDLGILAQAGEAATRLNANLVTELSGLRADVTTIQKQNVELDEALRDVTTQLDSTIAANRALREELQRANEEKGQMLATIAQYQGLYGEVSEVGAGNIRGIIPPVNLATPVIGVRQSNDRTLVEIEAGSRDGVQKDWLMTVGRGGTLIGRLRIIQVDVNRSVGELMLDDRLGTEVQIGDMAFASPQG